MDFEILSAAMDDVLAQVGLDYYHPPRTSIDRKPLSYPANIFRHSFKFNGGGMRDL